MELIIDHLEDLAEIRPLLKDERLVGMESKKNMSARRASGLMIQPLLEDERL